MLLVFVISINSSLLDIRLNTLINYFITNLADTLFSMEVKNYGYSLKIVPIPSKSRFLKCMVEKVECSIRRLRWKKNYQDDDRRFTNFGFKTSATAPLNKYLNTFKIDMYEMIRKTEFIKVGNDFQDKPAQDLQTIRSSKYV